MADEEKKVTILTEEQRKKLKERSAFSLPDNPSNKGWSAEQIKRKMYEPLLYLFDLVRNSQVDINEILEQIYTKTESDNKFATKENTYTKEESDERYLNIVDQDSDEDTLKGTLYTEASTPYFIGKQGKVGIRALEVDSKANAGQYAISYEVDSNGKRKYFANIVTLGSDGYYYSLRISQDGIQKVFNDGSDNRVKETLATENYVNNKVADLIGSAPETLNTLQELSKALGDNENFASDIAQHIGENRADIDVMEEKVSVLENSVGNTKGMIIGEQLVMTNVSIEGETLIVNGVRIEDGVMYINE